MSRRDSQRQRLYNAEAAAWATVFRVALDAGAPAPFSHERLDRAEVERYLRKLKRSAFFRRRFPGCASKPTKIVARHRTTGASFNGNAFAFTDKFSFPRDSVRWIVIHELAHAAADSVARGEPGHGRTFARVYLDLVRWQFGRETWSLLQSAFRLAGIRYVRVPLGAARRPKQPEPEAFRRYREEQARRRAEAAARG